MSVEAASARPRKSAGAAGLGTVLTLIIFIGVFVTFLVAPLIALGVAYLAWTVMKPREKAAAGPAAADRPTHSFGAGAQ